MSDIKCPHCAGPLREWTYAEMRARAVEQNGGDATMAVMLMPVMYGPYGYAYCEACQRPISAMQLMAQCVTVTPMRDGEE